jgi:Holliday junction resolvase RusA-like endonuclease
MITFKLYSNLPSGKNAVKITRTGHRYPDKRFKLWRDEALLQINKQRYASGNTETITYKCGLVVDYTPGDRIIRDVPGLLDALCHVLEKAGVVKSDGLIRDCKWHEFPIDREHPMAVVTIRRLT